MRQTIVCILLAAMIMACSSRHVTESIETATIDTTALKVAVMPTLDCLPLYVAQDRGLFARDSVDVSLIVYQAHMDCDTALLRGRVDGMMSDLVRTEIIRQQGFPVRYVSSTNLSWQLVTSQLARIKQPAQLYDKMLAMTRFSATALLADKVVSDARLDPDHVFFIQVNDVSVRLSMLETGVMDALLMPEPQATQARLAGCHVLLDTHADDLQLGVMAFSESALQSPRRQAQLDAFVRAYNAACDSINTHGPDAYRDLITSYCGVKAATVDSLPPHIRYEHASPPRPSDMDVVAHWLQHPQHE